MCEVLLQERRKQERNSVDTILKLHHPTPPLSSCTPFFFRLEDPNLPFTREKQLCVYIKKISSSGKYAKSVDASKGKIPMRDFSFFLRDVL